MNEDKKYTNGEFKKKAIKVLMYELKVATEHNTKVFSEKTNFINVPVNIGNGYNVYANTIVENFSQMPYILAIPENLHDNDEIIVTTINTIDNKDSSDRIATAYDIVGEGLELWDEFQNAPFMIIYVPNTEEKNEPYYQQLARECFTDKSRKYERIDLMVKKSIESAKQLTTELTEKKLNNKICLYGYSTPGVFAQRFASIHPEMVDKAIIGGAVGSIVMPNVELEYPAGVKDFKNLFGKEFNEKAYREIQFAYYVGELESQEIQTQITEHGKIYYEMHDMSYNLLSMPYEIGRQYRKCYGDNLQTRFNNCVGLLKSKGYRIVSKIYKEAKHRGDLFSEKYRYHTNFKSDLAEFYKTGIQGSGFHDDDSCVPKIITNPDLNVDER